MKQFLICTWVVPESELVLAALGIEASPSVTVIPWLTTTERYPLSTEELQKTSSRKVWTSLRYGSESQGGLFKRQMLSKPVLPAQKQSIEALLHPDKVKFTTLLKTVLGAIW